MEDQIMIKKNKTGRLRLKVLALVAVFTLVAATLTSAQERRSVAEIQADIDKLHVELREAVSAVKPITKIFWLSHVSAQEMQVHVLDHFKKQVQILTTTTDSRMFIVQGTESQLADLEVFLQRLDVAPSTSKAVIKSFILGNTLSSEIVKALKQLLPNDDTVQISADVRTNSVLVKGSEGDLKVVEALLRKLDVKPTGNVIRVFQLKHANANRLADTLTSLFASTVEVPIRFVADVGSNSIIAIGSEPDLTVVEALLVRLDRETEQR
jgi:type II secretory pathway component GspD/PulD (secretin)